MPKKTDNGKRGLIARYSQAWNKDAKVFDPMAVRLSNLSHCMILMQLVIALICGIYFAIEMGPKESYTCLILGALMIVFGVSCTMKAQRIQKLSALGDTKEMEHVFRQGKILICIFSAAYIIATLILLLCLLR